MAANIVLDSEIHSSDTESAKSDHDQYIDSSDFSDSDIPLLNNAYSIMESISPARKPIPVKARKVVAKKTGTTVKQDETPKRSMKTKQKDKKVKKETFKKKKLTKTEIHTIVDMLKAKKDNIVQQCLKKTLQEKCWDAEKTYRESIDKCKGVNAFKSVSECIFEDYISIYMSCDKGNTKYDDFQLLWFRNISMYLKDAQGTVYTDMKILETVISCKDIKHFLSCLVATLHQTMFDICCKATVDYLQPVKNPCERNKVTIHCDEDHALLRVHGWVLYEVVNHTKKQNTGLSDEEKSMWDKYSATLKSDKSELPQQLKNLDRNHGEGLTFPNKNFLPFAQDCDILYKELSNDKNCLQYGKHISDFIKIQMKCHTILEDKFFHCAMSLIEDTPSIEIIKKIYEVWMDKFCNLRIKDTFLVGKEKLLLKHSHQITTLTQNLRDGLLTDHVKAKK